MKSTRKTLGRVLALALVVIMALTAAIPAFAANENPNTKKLTITIHNNEGLPQLKADSFDVFQLFTGTPYREGEPVGPDWDANQWNNWSLADIGWGASVYKAESEPDAGDGYDHSTEIIDGLKALTHETAPWAVGADNVNPFASVSTAASLADVLEGKDNTFMQGFAKWLIDNKHIETLGLTGTVDTNGTADNYADDTLTYTVPGPGYYVFAEKLTPEPGVVSEYIIAVLGNQDIDLKASIPDVDKDIVVGGSDKKGDVDGVGDVVTFKLTGTLPRNYGDFETYYYEFVDNLSKGLTLTETPFEVTVKVGTSIYTIASTEYTVSHTTAPDTGITNIRVVFNDLKGKAVDGVKSGLAYTAVNGAAQAGNIQLDAQSEIYVVYTATVNTDAVIGVNGNPNDVKLVYSNDPNHDSHGETIERRVYVYAFGIDIIKLASDTKKGLEGAGFTLKNEGKYAHFVERRNETGDKVIGVTVDSWVDATVVDALIGQYKAAVRTYESATSENQAAAKAEVDRTEAALKPYLLMSDADGNLPDVYGLDDGTYTLTEVITPAGYNTMAPFEFSITAVINETTGLLESVTYTHDSEVIVYKGSYAPGEVDGDADEGDLIAHFTSGLLPDELENDKAPLLPFTGGIGTVIFYVAGSLMIAGAVIYLVIAIRRRRSEDNSAL